MNPVGLVSGDEAQLEAAHRLDRGLALGFLACKIGTGLGVDPATGDRDDVQCAVELPVAAAMEAVAVASPRGCRNRSDTGHPGEMGIAGPEARHQAIPAACKEAGLTIRERHEASQALHAEKETGGGQEDMSYGELLAWLRQWKDTWRPS
jgi:hypothetical protein